MKQCPRCGGQLKGRFCGKCGFDTEADAKVGSNSGKNYPQKFEAEQKTQQTDSGKNYPRKPAASLNCFVYRGFYFSPVVWDYIS